MIFHRIYFKSGQKSGLGSSTGGREHAGGGGSAQPREMTNDEMLAKLKEAAANNPELAAQLKQEFGGKATKKAPSAPKATTSVDPVSIFHNQGADALNKALKSLSEPELRAIIKQYSMDSAHRTGKWKADKLREHIANRAKTRATQGDVFLNFKNY